MRNFIGSMVAACLVVAAFAFGQHVSESRANRLIDGFMAAELLDEQLHGKDFYRVACGSQEVFEAVLDMERAQHGDAMAHRLRLAMIDFCSHSRDTCDYDETCA